MDLVTCERFITIVILFSYIGCASATDESLNFGSQSCSVNIEREGPLSSQEDMYWSINSYNFLLTEINNSNLFNYQKTAVPFSAQNSVNEYSMTATRQEISFEEHLLFFHKRVKENPSKKIQKVHVKVSEPNSLYILLVTFIVYVFILNNKTLYQHLRNV